MFFHLHVCACGDSDAQPDELHALVDDTDRTRSGVVDFDDFVSAIHCSGGGSGGNHHAVARSDASSFLGFLNPLSWFGSDRSAPRAAPRAAAKVELVPTRGLPAERQTQLHTSSTLAKPPGGVGSFGNNSPSGGGSSRGGVRRASARVPMCIMMSECAIKYAQAQGQMDIKGGKWQAIDPKANPPQFPSWLLTAYDDIDLAA